MTGKGASSERLSEAVVYLKQLVGFELLGAEHNAVGVTSDSHGLAAVAEQDHILAVFTVESMGDASYYPNMQERRNMEKRL